MVSEKTVINRLNPYCSGIWSRRTTLPEGFSFKFGLNPYCSGIWSRSVSVERQTLAFWVS